MSRTPAPASRSRGPSPLRAAGRTPPRRSFRGSQAPTGATREELQAVGSRVSQKAIERAARSIEGHETDPCPLEHPTVGRLRCGEWLLFAGVHDLMHLEQLQAIEASLAG